MEHIQNQLPNNNDDPQPYQLFGVRTIFKLAEKNPPQKTRFVKFGKIKSRPELHLNSHAVVNRLGAWLVKHQKNGCGEPVNSILKYFSVDTVYYFVRTDRYS